MAAPANTLYYGDNLHVLREKVASESVDLIYLDPPFNSARDYNVIFKEQTGESSPAQIKAFTDSWRWNETAFHEFTESCPSSALIELMHGFINTLGRNDLTAYLVMMAARIVELHRVLKSTGSIYLHCDPVASHYLKVVLDVVFGPKNFRNEIVWKRTSAHGNVAVRFGNVHDVVLFYTKSQRYTWNQQFMAYDSEYVETFFDQTDEQGRRYARRDLTASMERASKGQIYEFKGIIPPPSRCWAMTKIKMEELEEQGRLHWPKKLGGMPRLKLYPEDLPGVPVQDLWTDVRIMHNLSSERLGYPTQKPLALLERIIAASSNEGDVVLDPFCGCGTATIAAQSMKRHWIGIDITHLAISLIKYRLSDVFGLYEKLDYRVIGAPVTSAEARALALQDRDEFQRWAVGLVPRARLAQEKKGADRGIDGVLYFRDDPRTDAKKGMIQVKSGHLGVSQVRDFRGVVEREKATLGLFLSLDTPTRPMVQEADQLGFYVSPLGQRRIPRLQIRTVGDLLDGREFDIPASAVFEGVKSAPAHRAGTSQIGFDF